MREKRCCTPFWWRFVFEMRKERIVETVRTCGSLGNMSKILRLVVEMTVRQLFLWILDYFGHQYQVHQNHFWSTRLATSGSQCSVGTEVGKVDPHLGDRGFFQDRVFKDSQFFFVSKNWTARWSSFSLKSICLVRFQPLWKNRRTDLFGKC